ncbi:MAG TPA: hypothetical protein VF719_05815 [Abditibacteriaceae bacterium]|jgi:hypothetical protein
MRIKLVIACVVATTISFIIYTQWPRQPEKTYTTDHSLKPSKEIPTHLKRIFPLDSREVFDRSQRITVYALDPHSEGYKGKNSFHGYKVLDSARLTRRLRKELRTAFYENVKREGVAALCFFPHHGLRAQRGGKTLDFVICFGCAQLVTHYSGQESGVIFSRYQTSRFNAIYKKSGVTIRDTEP